jgi:hypothetical protein
MDHHREIQEEGHQDKDHQGKDHPEAIEDLHQVTQPTVVHHQVIQLLKVGEAHQEVETSLVEAVEILWASDDE